MNLHRRVSLLVVAVVAVVAVGAAVSSTVAWAKGGRETRSVLGTPVSFVSRGSGGVPILLVHGFPLDRTMWRAQIARLSQTNRVVAVDLPGFGRSGVLGDGTKPVTMERYAAHVMGLADQLGLKRFVLGGFSMGGYVALAAAQKHPERLAGLILLDTQARPDTAAAREGRLQTAQAVLAGGTAGLAQALPARLFAPTTLTLRGKMVGATQALIRGASRAGVAGALRGMGERADARPHLAGLAGIPTLIVVGAEDALTPPELSREMAAAMPGAELVVVPGAGHMAPVEQPRPVNDAIHGFVGKLTSAAPR